MPFRPGRFLLPVLFQLLLYMPAVAAWQKILVLPPESDPTSEWTLRENFQWDLADHLDRSRYFEIITRKEYESFLNEHHLQPDKTIPDSALRQLMTKYQSDILARSVISQPGGNGTKLSAQVTYVFPKSDYTNDDYVLISEQYSVEDESRSWYLAKEFVGLAVDNREILGTMSNARAFYKDAVRDRQLEKYPHREFMEKALKDYSKLVRMEPGNRTFIYMEGVCLLSLSKDDAAVAKFNHILAKIDPDHLPSHEKLAHHYFHNGDFENALRHFRKLAEINPQNYSYTKHCGLCLSKLGRKDEAVDIFEKLIGINDDDPAIRHQMAEYYWEKVRELQAEADKDAARDTLVKAVEYMSRSCDISRGSGTPADTAWMTIHCARLNFLAILQRELNGSGKEISTLREIAELNPAFQGACYNLGVYAHKAGDFEKAIEYYLKAIDCADEAQKAALNFQIGVINLREFKNYPAAIDGFTAALATSDLYEKEMARYLRGTAYYNYANELDHSTDKRADISSLIRKGTISNDIVNQALELYDKSLADFRLVSLSNPDILRSMQQHTDKIVQLQKRLNKIRQQLSSL